MAEHERLALDEGPQARGQISGLRQCRSVNQHRHHPDVPLQGRLDLDTNPILRTVDPPYSLDISDSGPVPPDEREQDSAPRHGFGNCPGEVRPDGDGVNVHEDAVFTETVNEMIIQTAS